MTSGERGIAVIVAMMGLLLISALAAALVLGTSTETLIAKNFQTASTAGYAADAALRYVLDELPSTADWSEILDGSSRSGLNDGLPAGERKLPGGSTIDLTAIVSLANCGKLTACSDAEMDAITAERPWGSNNPRWRLYASAPFADLARSASESRMYIVVLVADDPSEVDGNPSADGQRPQSGSGVIVLRAEAFGPAGAHAVIESTAERVEAEELDRFPGTPPIRLRTWRFGR